MLDQVSEEVPTTSTVPWRVREEREKFAAWINAPLSEEGREYRKFALGAAFGLHVKYIEDLMRPPVQLNHGLQYQTSMGMYLMLEVLEWMDSHPDLNQNNPLSESDITGFADMID